MEIQSLNLIENHQIKKITKQQIKFMPSTELWVLVKSDQKQSDRNVIDDNGRHNNMLLLLAGQVLLGKSNSLFLHSGASTAPVILWSTSFSAFPASS